jgi:hypothetical protein
MKLKAVGFTYATKYRPTFLIILKRFMSVFYLMQLATHSCDFRIQSVLEVLGSLFDLIVSGFWSLQTVPILLATGVVLLRFGVQSQVFRPRKSEFLWAQNTWLPSVSILTPTVHTAIKTSIEPKAKAAWVRIFWAHFSQKYLPGKFWRVLPRVSQQ